MLPKTSVYVNILNEQTNKWMFFFIQDNELLEKYNTISNKVIAHIKNIDSQPF